MKIKLEIHNYYGKRRGIRFTAKIIKSPTHGIPRTVQKTWRVFCDDPESERKEVKRMCVIQAKRWQHTWMMAWFGTPEKFPQQMEIEDDEYNETSEQAQPVPSVPEARLVSGGEVGGAVHENNVGEAKAPEGR